MDPHYVTLTQVIVDDVYFPNGVQKLNQLGGGTYTVAGTRIWSEQVGFCCLVGPDFDQHYRRWFDDNDIDLATVLKEKNTIHARIQYFDDGEREETPLPGCGNHEEMLPRFTDLPERYRSARGLYLYKDLEERFWNEANAWLKGYTGLTCWELAAAGAKAAFREQIADRLKLVDLFSLNLTEGRRITGQEDPLCVLHSLQEMNARSVILRMGARGALAADRRGVWEIPAAPTKVVDVTGGGNSSTGGFLVGYGESGGDIAYAARCAAVSASFIISQWSVPPRIDGALQEEARRRLEALPATKLE